jgi:hypothetical protein
MKNASQSTRLSAMLGNPLKLSTRWLMCDFPFRAPPQFGCLGYVLWPVMPLFLLTSEQAIYRR